VVALLFEPAGSSTHLLEAAAIAGLSLLYVISRNRSPTTAVAAESIGHRPAESARGVGLATLGVAAVVGVAVAVAAVVPVTPDRLALRDAVSPPLDPLDQVDPLLLVNAVQLPDAVPDEGVLDVSGSDRALDLVRLPIARLDDYDCRTGGFRSTVRAVASAGELPPLRSDPATTVATVRLARADSRVLPAPGNVVGVSVEGGQPLYVDGGHRMVFVGSTPIGTVVYRVRTAIEPDATGTSHFEVPLESPPSALARCAAARHANLAAAIATANVSQGSGQDRLQALARWCRSLTPDPAVRDGDDLSLDHVFGTGSRPGAVRDHGTDATAAQIMTACAAVGQMAGLPVQVAVGYVASGSGGSAAARTRDLTAWLEVRDVDGLLHPVAARLTSHSTASVDPETSADPRRSGDRDASPPADDPSRFQPSTSPDDGGPPWVLFAVFAVAAAVLAAVWVGSKGAWRRRRRRHGTPPQRLAGAWAEAVDCLRSVGVQADSFGPEDIAMTADAFPQARESIERLGAVLQRTFAPDPPTTADADEAWRAVDELRRRLRRRGWTIVRGSERSGPSDDGAHRPVREDSVV
jgi:hypothetical protein